MMIKADDFPAREQLDGVVTMLNLVLAEECLLYSKTRNCYWDATQPEARSLRDLFEQQYDREADIIDNLTGRIRVLGAQSMGTMSEFLQYARLKEHPGQHPPAARMIAHLLDDHEALMRTLKGDLAACQEGFKDAETGDFLNWLVEEHESMARTLRAQLNNT
jgi:starvation-inducible DNA-binding protein